MKLLVTGGTGFVGRRFCTLLHARGHEAVVLSRVPSRRPDGLPASARLEAWDPGALGRLLGGADAVVHLAGEPVAQRWTAAARERIAASRVGVLDALRAAVEKGARAPRVLVSASAVGYYGARGEEELTEESAPGTGFLAETCVRWEEAALSLGPLGTRVVTARIGVVLGEDGGALSKMLPAFRLGAGGPVGSGEQWMSWIHRDDLAALLVFALEKDGLSGALNATSATPARNRDFARALGRALRRPAPLPVPAFALRAAFGEMASILLEGQKVLPVRTLASGFDLRYPDLDGALSGSV